MYSRNKVWWFLISSWCVYCFPGVSIYSMLLYGDAFSSLMILAAVNVDFLFLSSSIAVNWTSHRVLSLYLPNGEQGNLNFSHIYIYICHCTSSAVEWVVHLCMVPTSHIHIISCQLMELYFLFTQLIEVIFLVSETCWRTYKNEPRPEKLSAYTGIYKSLACRCFHLFFYVRFLHNVTFSSPWCMSWHWPSIEITTKVYVCIFPPFHLY